MLFYGNEFVFRTIPDTSYDVLIFGYRVNPEFENNDGDIPIPHDYWLRYIAYGAGMNYARDFGYEQDVLSLMEYKFQHERALLLTRTHNQIKIGRCQPQF
jgi:hypothetical protein